MVANLASSLHSSWKLSKRDATFFFVMDERKLAEKGLFSWTLVFFEWDAFLFLCVFCDIFGREKTRMSFESLLMDAAAMNNGNGNFNRNSEVFMYKKQLF